MSITTTTHGAVLVATAGRPSELAARLGVAVADAAGGWPADVRQVVILAEAPEDTALLDTTEETLTDLVGRLQNCVHLTQAAAQHFRDHGTEGGTIAALLPASAALGRAKASIPGALVDGLMSFFRTIAIELRKEVISLNVVFHDTLEGEDADAVAALLAGYRSAPAITGQETYTCYGPNLGKVKP